MPVPEQRDAVSRHLLRDTAHGALRARDAAAAFAADDRLHSVFVTASGNRDASGAASATRRNRATLGTLIERALTVAPAGG